MTRCRSLPPFCKQPLLLAGLPRRMGADAIAVSQDEYISGALHHVVLGTGPEGPLQPNTTYFYTCGDPDLGMSPEFSFSTPPVTGPESLPYRRASPSCCIDRQYCSFSDRPQLPGRHSHAAACPGSDAQIHAHRYSSTWCWCCWKNHSELQESQLNWCPCGHQAGPDWGSGADRELCVHPGPPHRQQSRISHQCRRPVLRRRLPAQVSLLEVYQP